MRRIIEKIAYLKTERQGIYSDIIERKIWPYFKILRLEICKEIFFIMYS